MSESIIISIALSLICTGLALIHFNQAIGGSLGFVESLLTKENGEWVLKSGKIDNTLVGLGQTLFGFFYLIKSTTDEINLPEWIMKFGKLNTELYCHSV